MLLEALRRLTKEYDRYLLRNHIARNAAASTTPSSSDESSSSSSSSGGGAAPNKDGATVSERSIVRRAPGKFRPNVGQQAIRALLHMATFAVAYFVMLLGASLFSCPSVPVLGQITLYCQLHLLLISKQTLNCTRLR